MVFEDRRPKQLENKRKEHYNRVYPRQKQIMERLNPFLNKSDVIEDFTNPRLPHQEYFSNDTQQILLNTTQPILDGTKILIQPKLNGKNRIRLRKKLNKFSNRKRKSKIKSTKRISQIRPDVLFGMSR